jgi:hypothetical protein
MDELVVVGGGPSLLGFDWESLRGRRTIAANYSIFSVPEPTYFITIDRWFFDKIGEEKRKDFQAIQCRKYFINVMGERTVTRREDGSVAIVHGDHGDFDFRDFHIIQSDDCHGFGRSTSDFRNGNSGYCAVQLALILGARTIRLLGIDNLMPGDMGHYHDAYLFNRWNMPSYRQQWRDGLQEIGRDWPEVGVVSHSPISELNQYVRYEPWK